MIRILFLSRTLLFIVIFCAGLTFNSAHANKYINQCKTHHTRGIIWKYCISKMEGSHNPDLIYMLHGLYGNAKEWNLPNNPILKEWEKGQVEAPTVVTISFGKFWILAPESGSKKSGKYLNILIQVMMPFIEQELGGLQGKRILVGTSMGGFNATEIYMFYPKLFDRVALLCPAITELSPFANRLETKTYIEQTNANRLYVLGAQKISHFLFKKLQFYKTISPFDVAPVLLQSSHPRIYLSIGMEDQLGLFKSVEKFAHLIKSKGIEMEWKPVHGGHCTFDAPSAANFLID